MFIFEKKFAVSFVTNLFGIVYVHVIIDALNDASKNQYP